MKLFSWSRRFAYILFSFFWGAVVHLCPDTLPFAIDLNGFMNNDFFVTFFRPLFLLLNNELFQKMLAQS